MCIRDRLLGGSKVKKNHSRLEAYGTIDELNAFIGNIFDQKIDQISNIALLKIQNRLFDLGSNIAYDHKNSLIKLQHLDENDVLDIEKEIDRMEKKLPILTNFILPSGHKTTSICHIARTVCRRAERNLVELMQHDSCDEINIKYLNRLSDYLFVLARYNLAINNISEILWEKKK